MLDASAVPFEKAVAAENETRDAGFPILYGGMLDNSKATYFVLTCRHRLIADYKKMFTSGAIARAIAAHVGTCRGAKR